MKHLLIVMSLLITTRAMAQSAPPPPPAQVAAATPPAADPAAAATGAPATAPAAAVATTVTPGLDHAISVFGVFGYLYAGTGVGLAGRYQKTILPEVLKLPGVHEDIGLEGGLDYYHYGFDGFSINEFDVLVGIVWNFWFANDKLALYPKLETGFGFATVSGVSSAVGYGGFNVQASAGVAYKISTLTLRGEVGSGALRLGAGFVF